MNQIAETSVNSSTENRLLRRLAPEIQRDFLDRALRVVMPVGEVACEPGLSNHYIYLPTTGVLSTVVTLHDGSTVEAATIGNEGLVGLASVLDDSVNPCRTIQRVEGELLRIPSGEFRALLAGSPQMQQIVGRYVLTLLQQCAQNVACHLHHKVPERMARWLLTTSDRTGQSGFPVTQEFLGGMLGVSRQSVNATAGQLQQAGLIAYRRGKLQITNRPALESAACECYRVTNEAYRRLMRWNGNGSA